MQTKIVGIVLRQFVANFREIPLYGIRDDIIRFLTKYNVDIVCIPIDFKNDRKNEIERLKGVLNICDGIIFPGGIGINEIDCDVMRYLYEIDKPTLGICLGMQIMGKAFNGNVLSGGAEKIHDNSNKYAHNIKIKRDSKLYKIMGTSDLEVNSRHFDCVQYTDLRCVAEAEGNTIEAIEDESKRFFIGVQWHPESICDDKYSDKLFKAFVEAL